MTVNPSIFLLKERPWIDPMAKLLGILKHYQRAIAASMSSLKTLKMKMESLLPTKA